MTSRTVADVLAALATAACTDPTAVGTFDAPQTTGTYADGTVVHVDPAALVTTIHGATWDVAVISSTGWLVSSGAAPSLTTRLGTFSVDRRALPWVYTCPDGSRFHLEDRTRAGEAGCCAPPLLTDPDHAFSGLVTFGFWSMTPKPWRCQGAPFARPHPLIARTRGRPTPIPCRPTRERPIEGARPARAIAIHPRSRVRRERGRRRALHR